MSKKANPPLQPRDHAEAVALFRAEVIGALEHLHLERGERTEQLQKLSEKKFWPPGAQQARS